MSVEYRAERRCWTWRVYRYGKRHKGYGFATKAEAQQAEKAFLKSLSARPQLPATSFRTVSGQVVADACERRSHSRSQGLCLNLEKFILPYFGPTTLISDITPQQVEAFTAHHLKRVKPMTVWHYVKDLRATLNWAIKHGLLDRNPVALADLRCLSRRNTTKLPLSQAVVDKQASVLTGRDRLYFDTLRFCGLRKDESNCIQAQDIIQTPESLWLHVRGTKTAGSDRVIPLPPLLWEDFTAAKQGQEPGCLLFGRRGKKVYDRRKLFARAARESGTPVLKPKDLRDYFASIISDPLTASKMLGHTSLSTTAIYTRGVQERMLAGVANLGANNGGQPEALVGAKGFISVQDPKGSTSVSS